VPNMHWIGVYHLACAHVIVPIMPCRPWAVLVLFVLSRKQTK
jgi:hypothetical protein